MEDIGIPAKHTGNQETVDQTLVEARLQTLKLKGAGDETRDSCVPSKADTFLAQATVPGRCFRIWDRNVMFWDGIV